MVRGMCAVLWCLCEVSGAYNLAKVRRFVPSFCYEFGSFCGQRTYILSIL